VQNNWVREVWNKVGVIKQELFKFVGCHKSTIVLNESKTFAKHNLHKIYKSMPPKQHLWPSIDYWLLLKDVVVGDMQKDLHKTLLWNESPLNNQTQLKLKFILALKI